MGGEERGGEGSGEGRSTFENRGHNTKEVFGSLEMNSIFREMMREGRLDQTHCAAGHKTRLEKEQGIQACQGPSSVFLRKLLKFSNI